MRKTLMVLCVAVLFVPAVKAQSDHLEAGIFGDYFRQSQTDANLGGLGVRLGPKVELGHGRIRPFVVAKAGFDKFFINSCPVSFSCVSSQIANIHQSSVNAVFYPGGGLEGHLGPVGLRLDVGDEMYFNSGAHHNLRMAFGPYIRF